ncbi:histidinol dehydrogenase [Actibacterium ureilyticum]|uniref:histidinol dehydrogenase n=1 Tax=Actibacterium ureilyticum TaxID=1590614 RepID=UPI000BAAA7DE|nr:histidinol dehydrogenase [Actibacterium ureilyticum]
MTETYLKRAQPRPAEEQQALTERVAGMLDQIAATGEAAVADFARALDGWDGEIVLSRAELDRAAARVPDQLRDDIRFAHQNIRRFAEAQRSTLNDMQVELMPGMWAGQKQIPVTAAGCYVPGGRYTHISSALMTVTTARVAGVSQVVAASPPRQGAGIPDAVLYAMDLAGADTILALGGVQAVAAMAGGLFGTRPADVLAGPGNAFVAEAKRQLFGAHGIDMFAGPTDVLIVADSSADADTVAWDLISQAEHGPDSPVWLVTDDRALAEAVLRRAPELAAQLPEVNAAAARTAWDERAEVILCAGRDEMAAVADRYAPEHLHVQARDLDWWLGRLRVYGALFLGAETTVAFGDKAAGPNHVLPTSGAARYTGGLSVQKFIKTVTWQRCDTRGMVPLAEATARISRLEGMAGHATAAELRLKKGTVPAQ